MNNNKKIYVIIFAIIVIIVSIIVIVMLNNKMRNEPSYDEIKDEMIDYIVENNNVVRKISDFSNIGAIKTCIQVYYQSLILTNQENIQYTLIAEGDSDYYRNKLYNILSKDYIEKNNVKKESLDYKKVVKDFYIDIISLYKISSFEDDYYTFGNIDVYIVNGIFRNLDDKLGEEFTMVLAIDNINRNFEIWPSDYLDISKYTTLKVGDKIDFEIPKEIEENEYNKFSTNYTSIDDLARLEFNTIIDLILYDTEKAYDLLTEEGKKIYSSIENLEQFKEENKSDLALINYSSNTMNLENSVLTLDCYDSNYKYKITIVFDEFSSFTYSIEKIEE